MTYASRHNEWALPGYSDLVLPFNVTLTGANEYGAMTRPRSWGVKIFNEGPTFWRIIIGWRSWRTFA